MLDVLLFLPVTRGLCYKLRQSTIRDGVKGQRRTFESLDDERAGGGDDGDGGLTVLDGQFDSDTETLPVTSGLGDIFTDLCSVCQQPAPRNCSHAGKRTLWRQTERTDLGRKGGGGTDLTSSGTEVDNLLLVGIELGSFTIISALSQGGRGDVRVSV